MYDHLPERSGIYAIVNRNTGERYVGQAVNMRDRARHHVRELDRGRHFASIKRRWLQEAWSKYGRDSFEIVVLEEVPNNRAETSYHLRPDNLSLAEHWYIAEKSEYNPDKGIVRSDFAHLIERKAWRDVAMPGNPRKIITDTIRELCDQWPGSGDTFGVFTQDSQVVFHHHKERVRVTISDAGPNASEDSLVFDVDPTTVSIADLVGKIQTELKRREEARLWGKVREE